MDLYKISQENKSWILSKNIIYVDYIAKIPMLRKQGDDIFVYLDCKIHKHVLNLVKILQDRNIDFLFKSTVVFFDQNFSDDEIHTLNLRQYIRNICNEKFFDGFQKIGFDYTGNLTKYLVKFSCYEVFKTVYENEKKSITSTIYSWWTWSNTKEYRNREDIRNYITSLEREIKISLLF